MQLPFCDGRIHSISTTSWVLARLRCASLTFMTMVREATFAKSSSVLALTISTRPVWTTTRSIRFRSASSGEPASSLLGLSASRSTRSIFFHRHAGDRPCLLQQSVVHIVRISPTIAPDRFGWLEIAVNFCLSCLAIAPENLGFLGVVAAATCSLKFRSRRARSSPAGRSRCVSWPPSRSS